MSARRSAIDSDYQTLCDSKDARIVEMMSQLTLVDFEWALSMVWSRAFWMRHTPDGEREATFIPYVDLANHHHSAAQVRPTHAGVVIQLESSMKAGQQVEISYGDLANSDLLIRYGFVLDDNVHDTVPLFVKCGGDKGEESATEDENLQVNRHLSLEMNGLPPNNVYKISKHGLPPTLIEFMRISTCIDTESLLDSEHNFKERGPLHGEAVALYALLLLVKGQLLLFETSLKEDKALLANKEFRGLHHELAVRFRVSQKTVWSRAMLCVKREGMVAISSMGRMAAEAMDEAEKEKVGDILTKIVTQPAQVEPVDEALRGLLRAGQRKSFSPDRTFGAPE